MVALVDDEDVSSVLTHRWHVQITRGKVTYAVRSIRSGRKVTKQAMHTFLTGYAETDHRNRNGLDNRRANLREATRSENRHNQGPPRNNTSGYKGVSRSGGRWRAQIMVDGKRRSLGRFARAEEAARVYDAAAIELHGTFAWVNFPDPVAHHTSSV